MHEFTAGPAYRADLEGLRGVAILSVFAVHTIPDALRGGFIGVDVFFVISGYLIASITLRELGAGRFSILGFYARRIRRLAPALLFVLSTCLVFGAVLAYPKESKEIGRHVSGGALFVSNLVLWQEAGYFDQSSAMKPLLHLWSLGIEEQFYLLWPIAAVLLLPLRRRGIALVAMALLASFALNVVFVGAKPKGTFFLPPTRFWEILVGVLLAYWTHHTSGGPIEALRCLLPVSSVWRSRVPDVLSAIGVAALLSSLWLIDRTDRFPGWWALLPTAGTFLVIASGARSWVNRVALSHPILTFYGRISYPLYLWHWPLLTFPLLLDYRLTTGQSILMLCLSVGLATFTYCAVEKPFRFGVLAGRAPWVLTTGLVLAALAGWGLFQTDGLLDRYPEAVRSIAQVQVRTDYERYRVGRCFLRSEQKPGSFAAECVDGSHPERPLLLLWGDSHAAALFPGLQDNAPMAPGHVRLAQYTAAACPPGLTAPTPDNPQCAEVNAYVRDRIARLRPHTVVLAANWSASLESEPGVQQPDALKLVAETIATLRSQGVQNVIVFGPLPRWHIAPPRILLKAWAEARPLPERSDQVLDPPAILLDQALKRAVSAAGGRYLSPIGALCDRRGCIVSISRGSRYEAIAFDETHLTSAGSRLLIDKLSPYSLP